MDVSKASEKNPDGTSRKASPGSSFLINESKKLGRPMTDAEAIKLGMAALTIDNSPACASLLKELKSKMDTEIGPSLFEKMFPQPDSQNTCALLGAEKYTQMIAENVKKLGQPSE